jgi:hypothetical protein
MADNNDVERFLKTIAHIESSNGTDFNHPTIKSGPQKGQTAIGTYGLLPNTVDEIVDRAKDPQLNILKDMSPDEQKEYLESHPDTEHKAALFLAKNVLDKQGDPEKAAYAWNHGHNLSPEQVDARDYGDSDYVQKFNKISGAINPKPKSVKAGPVANIDPLKESSDAPPLDIGGTDEGDTVQQGLESSPTADTLAMNKQNRELAKQKMNEMFGNQNKAITIASRPTWVKNTPEEDEMVEKNLDPLTRGLVSGGAMIGGVGTEAESVLPPLVEKAAKYSEDVADIGTNAYKKVRGMLNPSNPLAATKQALVNKGIVATPALPEGLTDASKVDIANAFNPKPVTSNVEINPSNTSHLDLTKGNLPVNEKDWLNNLAKYDSPLGQEARSELLDQSVQSAKDLSNPGYGEYTLPGTTPNDTLTDYIKKKISDTQ